MKTIDWVKSREAEESFYIYFMQNGSRFISTTDPQDEDDGCIDDFICIEDVCIMISEDEVEPLDDVFLNTDHLMTVIRLSYVKMLNQYGAAQ